MNGYNIYRRKDGRWEGRIFETSSDGKRKYKSFFGSSREIVVQKMDAFRASYLAASSASPVFECVFHKWFQSMQHRIKASTAANYSMKAEKHLLPAFGNIIISEIEEDSVYRFIEEKQSAGLSDRYIADILSLMRSVCKYAARRYRIRNPMSEIRQFKRKPPEIKLLDKEEHDRLTQYVMENQTRTNLGIALTMATGLRIGELCAFKCKDIDIKKRIMTVRHTIQRIQCPNGDKKTKLIITEPKSESSKRVIPIPESMIPYLSEFMSEPDNFLLSGTEKPVEPRTMQNRFARILNNVNLPSVHFHSLRHYFASSCIRLGFDVKALSELLGHCSVEITLNRYVHSTFEQKRQYMDRIKMVV